MFYAITDIETTGGNALREKITEIAIYKFDGEKIVDQLVTLINPERNIPFQIQQLTGITNEMVADAPKFYEVAKKVVEITKDCIFVAHNATFDYNFIKQEFKSLGYDFQRENLCTVKLSRKLLPGLPSYSLGVLSSQLGIEIEARHRASGDALATVELFSILIKKHSGNDISDVEIAEVLKGLNSNLDKKVLKTLPENTGVYYFLNEQHEPIYIGKSINIKKRVHSHFSNKKSTRAIEMKSQTAHIDYAITGSEMVALLHESAEVKSFMPHFNRLLRRSTFSWGLFAHTDDNGYINLGLQRINQKNGSANVLFSNKKEAENYLHKIIEDYKLCQKLCGVYQSKAACFHYQIGMCEGACMGEEDPEEYNHRVLQFLEKTTIPNDSFFIIDKGRNTDEKSVIKISHGVYKGFGYFEPESIQNSDELHDFIQPADDNKDARSIINSFLSRKKYEKIIYFKEF
jgi:DNA polymerase-3 subunit epsilon